MADAKLIEAQPEEKEPYVAQTVDIDPNETAEWIDSLKYVLASKGPDRVKYLLTVLEHQARREGVDLPTALNTPYINTIHSEDQSP